jgi:dihydrofolate synthase/folylpolyglutamate synthase
VAGRQPLCILDGAHNADGARALAAALAEEFATAGPRIVVLGLLKGRDPGEILLALDPSTIRLVVACPPPSPRALDPEETAHAARAAGIDALIEPTVPRAVDRALAEAADGDLLLITGSLYTVGAARTFLLR